MSHYLVEQYVKSNPNHTLAPILEINEIPINPINNSEKQQLKTFIYQFKTTLINISTKFRLTLTKDTFEDFKKLILHFNIFGPIKAQSKNFEKELKYYFEANKYLINYGNEKAQKAKVIDFSDMLYLPYRFKLYPASKFDLLFIDECQDLSNSQIAVALKYVKKTGRLLSVGDPWQSIYGFAGADIESYNRIKNIPNTVQLTLSKCFRCPNNVIELAQNFREDITPFSDKDGKIEKISFPKVVDFVKPNDLIISRLKNPLLELLFLLIDKGIKVEVHEDDVKDIINSIRFIFTKEELNQKNIHPILEEATSRNIYFIEKAAKDIPDREEREVHIKRETQILHAKLKLVKKQSSIHVDVKNINDLLKKIKYLISGNENTVKLSTIHRAKGLENNRIFILDFDLLPFYRDGQKAWEKRQERNLKYVALTRTKKELYLVESQQIELDRETQSLFDEIDWL